jgi:ATP-dependent DNA helicase RecG
MVDSISDFSARILDLGPDAVDSLEVERLRRILAAKEPASSLLGLSNDELLERLGVLVREGGGERNEERRTMNEERGGLRLTVAGLLLVGKEEVLRQQLPGHEAIYLHMKSDTEYDKRVDSARPLLAILEQFTQAFEPYNRIYTLKLGLFHFEIPDFPEEVCREALLNAFVHRDYGRSGPV